MSRIATLLGIFVVAPLVAVDSPPPTALAVVEAFHADLVRQDREAVMGHLAPNAILFEAGGAEMSPEEYASHHLAYDMEFAAATERRVTSRKEDRYGTVAWVLTRFETTGSLRDRPVALEGVETMLLAFGPDRWRIVHVHWSSRTRKEK